MYAPFLKVGFFRNRVYENQNRSNHQNTNNLKMGVRCYSRVLGWILTKMGFAHKVLWGNKSFYLNKKSLIKWLYRKEYDNSPVTYDPLILKKIEGVFKKFIKKMAVPSIILDEVQFKLKDSLIKSSKKEDKIKDKVSVIIEEQKNNPEILKINSTDEIERQSKAKQPALKKSKRKSEKVSILKQSPSFGESREKTEVNKSETKSDRLKKEKVVNTKSLSFKNDAVITSSHTSKKFSKTKLKRKKIRKFQKVQRKQSKRKKLNFNEKVFALVSFLNDKEACNVEGIFRVPGEKTKIIDLKNKLTRKKFKQIDADTSIHTVCSALKQLFGEQEVKLLDIVKDKYLKIDVTKELNLDETKKMIDELSTDKKIIFTVLLTFLDKVIMHVDENKMSSSNLGTVWGPNLVSIDNIQNVKKINGIFAHILNYRKFFLDLLRN
jgi:hypothetical protein